MIKTFTREDNGGYSSKLIFQRINLLDKQQHCNLFSYRNPLLCMLLFRVAVYYLQGHQPGEKDCREQLPGQCLKHYQHPG
jgi:hypothetical protein